MLWVYISIQKMNGSISIKYQTTQFQTWGWAPLKFSASNSIQWMGIGVNSPLTLSLNGLNWTAKSIQTPAFTLFKFNSHSLNCPNLNYTLIQLNCPELNYIAKSIQTPIIYTIQIQCNSIPIHWIALIRITPIQLNCSELNWIVGIRELTQVCL